MTIAITTSKQFSMQYAKLTISWLIYHLNLAAKSMKYLFLILIAKESRSVSLSGHLGQTSFCMTMED